MPKFSFSSGLYQGWPNPSSTLSITYLSSTYSPSGASVLVAIIGKNFRTTSTIKFGTYSPTMIFISSEQIDFYVPNTAISGVYPVQVFNDSIPSNIIEYNIDSPPGYWILNSDIISNSNLGGLSVNGPIEMKNVVDVATSATIISNIVLTDNQSIQWYNSTGFASISSSANSIEIVGDLNVSGPVTAPSFTPTSDYRIKDIIEPLNDCYSVDNLKPVKYFNKKTERIEFGFIAHEMQEIFPELVSGEKDGKELQTLNYMGLISVLTKEIQILKEEVAELKRQR
jgi:hypothetical protein